MKEPFKISDFPKVLSKEKQPPNCDITMQIDPIRMENGYAEGIWEVDEKFINGNGVTMGGFLAAATDIMMAYAIASLLNDEQGFTTVDLHTTFHRPVTTGKAVVKAKVVNKGKRTAYLTGEILQNGKKCCSTVSTMMIFNA